MDILLAAAFPAASLIRLVIVLVVIGVVLWLLSTIPIDPRIRVIINVVIVIAVCLWLLSYFSII